MKEWFAEQSPSFQEWVRSLVADGEITPDGLRYLSMARGDGAMKPYHYRWLLPKLLGDDTHRWALVSTGSVIAMVPAMRWLTGRWGPGLFVFGLHGIWDNARRYPTLVDPPAMLAAIVAAAATKHRRWGTAAAASLVAGSIKESAPVFAAVYAMNPLPLVGLLSPAVRSQQPPGEDVETAEAFTNECLTHPVQSAWWVRRGKARDWRYWIAPWGTLLLGVDGSPRTVTTLGLAHGQCFAAVDQTRLVQWAWPVLADSAVTTTGRLWPLAALLNWFNPWRESA